MIASPPPALPPQSAPPSAGDALEILPVDLLDSERERIARLRRLARELVIPLGWHYPLDLAWILQRLGPVGGAKVLDAGAGLGVLQWHLSSEGAEVWSVDRSDRSRLPVHLRRRFNVSGARQGDLGPAGSALAPRALLRTAVAAALGGLGPRACGRVVLLRGDLRDLSAIPDGSVDAVVSVSALEHNAPEALPGVVAELLRVLVPGGRLLATLGASAGVDWLHRPSQGWCYSEPTLRSAFRIDPETRSNWERHDELFAALRASAELRRTLSWRYRLSGHNGMPWGRWNPRYQPVGVCKVKP